MASLAVGLMLSVPARAADHDPEVKVGSPADIVNGTQLIKASAQDAVPDWLVTKVFPSG